MIEYRRIVDTDVDAVSDFALQAMRAAGLPPLNLSAEKVRANVAMFARDDQHFQMAAFKDGDVVAAMAVYLVEMPFFERCEGHVFLCFSTEPGAGRHIIRAMLQWAKEDHRVQRIIWCMNEGADKLARQIARRYGFTHRMDMLAYYKGN